MMRSTFGRLFNKNLVLAAILICGVTMFTSCTNEDNPADPAVNLSEMIIGKWIETDINGQPAATNAKRVYTFVSTTKAYLSASLTMRPEYGACWSDQVEATVAIDGNKVILNVHHNEHKSAVHEFTVTVINESEFTAIRKLTITVDGSVVLNDESTIRFVKQTTDYAEPVLGLWECTGLTGGETYNDGNDRLEFLSDGTYRYYRKNDAGQWKAVTTREFQNYFVDGTLLATRWKNQGEDELREWWEIESLSGNEMVWTALRQNADGSTFQQKMTWKKIDLNVAEKILGKWMRSEINGHPMTTNEKMVITFVSTTKAYVSASLSHGGGLWNDLTETAVAIDGNKVTLTYRPEEHTTTVEECIVTAINDNEFSANYNATVTKDGDVVFSWQGTMRFVKQTTDFRASIIGTWQGRCTSEGSIFDDGQEHRWQYNADGTYVYYVKDGNNWVPYATNTLSEYFVDGNLLCTRWIDNGGENREWWEITIDGDKMNWTALRQKEDGSTFTATFEMTKVQ